MAAPKLGHVFPDFEAETTQGPIKFHDWIGDSWAILFSHPADFTPVCTTELSHVITRLPEFAQRKVKVIAISCNDVEVHKSWLPDIQALAGHSGDFPYPIIADPKRVLAVQFGMLDPEEQDAAGLPLTARAVFIIAPDKKMKLSILYPATTGRNFEFEILSLLIRCVIHTPSEIFRVIDSLQLTMYHKVATPVNWTAGSNCMVLPSIKAEELAATFPKGVDIREVPSGKGYLRFTPQPNV